MLCTSCWEKIEEFHKFYCEVASVHNFDVQEQLNQIKEESSKRTRKRIRKVSDDGTDDWKPPAIDSMVPEPVQVKLEVTEHDEQVEGIFTQGREQIKQETDDQLEESDEETETEDDDESEEEESDEDSGKPIAARRRQVKKQVRRGRRSTIVQKDAFILTHLEKLACDQCSKVFNSFIKLEKHCRETHDCPATVVCCNRPFQKLMGLYSHLCRHKSIYKHHCKECNRCFKNVDGLNMHNLLHHTPEEEKKFRCNMCETAFATETLLTSHINWHATVEPKNIVCKKCNK